MTWDKVFIIAITVYLIGMWVAEQRKLNIFETIATIVFFPIIALIYCVLWTFKILVAFVKILGKIFEEFDNSLGGN